MLSAQQRRITIFTMALRRLPGVGNVTVSGILEREKARITQAMRLDGAFAAEIGDFRVAQGLRNLKGTWEGLEERAEATLQACEERDIAALHPYMPEYPQRLLRVKGYPPILYCYGNVDALNPDRAVTIIGDNCSEAEECEALTLEVTGRLAADGHAVYGSAPGAYAFSIFVGALNGGGLPIVALDGSADDPQTLYGYDDLPQWVLDAGGAFVSSIAPGPSRAPYAMRENERWGLALGLADGLIAIEANYSGHAMYVMERALKDGIPLAVFDFREGIEGDRLGARRFLAATDRLESGQAYGIRTLDDLGGFEKRMDDFRAGAFQAPTYSSLVQAERGQATLF